MLFHSQHFVLIFLPLAVLLYYAAARSPAGRQWVLLVASLVFYGWWDGRFIPLLIGQITFSWLSAWLAERYRHRYLLIVGIVLNLLSLGTFKYSVEYLAHLLGLRSLARAARRMALLLGLGSASDSQGYSDYELGRTWSFSPPQAPRARAAEWPSPSDIKSFPGLEQLRSLLAVMPPLILVMPPVFYSSLPEPGSAQDARIARCKAEFRVITAGRPKSEFHDFFVDDAQAREPTNFMDASHYRSNVARLIEARIVEVLRSVHEALD